MKPIIGAKNSKTPSAIMDNVRIRITAPVKNKTVGTNITKATIINVVNDNIKAINNKTKTKTKAKPRNMKNANIVSIITIGIVMIINGDTNNANRNKKGSPSKRNGKNMMNTKPRPNRINGLNNTNRIMKPPNKKAPMTKNVPIVRNIKLPMKMRAKMANPPNTNPPASMKGKNITKMDTIPLNIIVAIMENAVTGNDNKNTKRAIPIQNTNVTPANTITATVNDPYT
jgi:hypothetical protein